MSQSSVINPKPFLNKCLGHRVICKLKWNLEYMGVLVSLDGYMNIRMVETEEYIDGNYVETIGDIMIRGGCILYIREFERNEDVNEDNICN